MSSSASRTSASTCAFLSLNCARAVSSCACACCASPRSANSLNSGTLSVPVASPVPCEAVHVHADVAVVAVERQRRQPVGRSRLALLFNAPWFAPPSPPDPCDSHGPADRRIHIHLVEGRIGRLVGQREALRQGQADGAGQGQLVFFQRVAGHNQLLLQRLVIHAGAQLIEQRRGARLVVGDRLVERNLGGSHLRFHAGDSSFVGQRQQVGVADRQHHQFLRVFGRKLRRRQSCSAPPGSCATKRRPPATNSAKRECR